MAILSYAYFESQKERQQERPLASLAEESPQHHLQAKKLVVDQLFEYFVGRVESKGGQ